VRWRDSDDACRKAGSLRAGVPSNGWDSGLLRTVADQAGAGEVWLAYHQDAAGSWTVGGPPPRPRPVRPIP